MIIALLGKFAIMHQKLCCEALYCVVMCVNAIADLWAFADKVERSEILRVVFCSEHYE